MDFSALPPEVNSGLLYAGPGAIGLIEAAQAWSMLSTELYATAAEYGSVITSLATTWRGPSSAAMQTAVRPYLAWLEATAAQADRSAVQAWAAAAAFDGAITAGVQPPVIAANRAQLLALVATNLFGQNTPAIAANEAQYAAMWAQDAGAMNAYAASSSAATSGLPQFTAAPNTTNPVEISQPMSQSAAAIGPGGWLDNTTTTGQLIQSLISSGFPFDVASLFVNFIGYYTIAAATSMSATARAAVTVPETPVTITPAPTPPAAPAPVTAASGEAGNIRGMSVPPSWARPPDTDHGRPAPTQVTPTRDRYQAAIPAVPFMPVTGLRSNQAKIRTDPEYGHVSKVLPPRNPAAG
jgi:PPE-repeat protein